MTIFRIILTNENFHALFQAKILLGRKLLMGKRTIYGRDGSAGELEILKIVLLPPAINAYRRENLDVSELSIHF